MLCRWTCITGKHVVVMSIMSICYGRTCPVGGHVLQVCAEAATVEAAVSLGNWCFFIFLQ